MSNPSDCPCGSKNTYDTCCGKFHISDEVAPTAEALMRSRYSAFVKHEIDYLKKTLWPANQKHFDEMEYLVRAQNSIWVGLTINGKEDGNEDDKQGTVTFTAVSMLNSVLTKQEEKSLFKKKNGRWYYVKPIG
jgi:SEC-C motif-containing protein